MADRRFEKTEQAIKKAMIMFLKDTSPGNITVTDICNAADINRSTFYAHYESVAALHLALEKELAKKYIYALSLYNYDTDTTALLKYMFNILKEDRDLFSLMYSDNSTGHALELIIEAEKASTLDVWSKESDLTYEELDYCYTYFFTGINAIFKKWVNSDFSMPEKQLMGLIDNVVKYGLYNDIYTK